ncbi:MAG: GSU2403 family nucleotidyltransferase fold protein [Thermodesulfobacteriota bacterium]
MNRSIQERAFFKVLEDLRHYLSYLVIVGGWVPYLYRNYLWKGEADNPYLTADIDIGIRTKIENFQQTSIYKRFTELQYSERHLSIGKAYPVVPEVKLTDDAVPIPVEFISGKDVSEDYLRKLVGSQILVNKLEYFEIILENVIKTKIEGKTALIEVFIPSPENYVFHKLLTFSLRPDHVKMRKDLYYIYYVLRFGPNPDRLLRHISRFKHRPEYKIARENVDRFFSNRLSEGVLLIAEEFGPDARVKDIREHILGIFQGLRAVLS